MKRFFALICVLLFVSGVSFAEEIDLSQYSLSELYALRNKIDNEIASRDGESLPEGVTTTTDKVIAFNDFTWGMDAEKASRMMEDKNLVSSSAEIKGPVTVYSWDDDFNGANASSYDDAGIRISEWCWGKTQVAGYSVQETDAFFFYDYKEGAVNYNPGESHLYNIQVHLEATDYDYAESDLTNKLTNLYGTPIESTKGGSSSFDSCHLWYGAEQTALCLYHHTSGSGKDRYDSLMLIYGKLDSEQELSNVAQIVKGDKSEQERQNSDNYDGL